MHKYFIKLMSLLAVMALSFCLSSCSDSDSDQDPGPDPVVQNPNELLAGSWSSTTDRMGQWVIDKDGHVNVLQHRHVFVMGGLDIYRDSSFVELTRAFDVNYDPKLQTLTFIQNEQPSECKVCSFEPTNIKYVDAASGDTCTMKKKGEYCDIAPESIAGFLMSAKRFKVHGMRFGSMGRATQYFYIDDVIDNLISEYTYTRGEGNTAQITYHVKYRLNPDKQALVTGITGNFTDATFDIEGKLDLKFLCNRNPGTDSETYYGEMDGNVIAKVTNNKKNTTTTSVITGHQFFALSKPED